AIDFIKEHSYPVRYDNTSIEQGMTVTGIEQALNEMPNIQSKQKTGRWIEQTDTQNDVYYVCSNCKEAFTLIEGTPTDNLYNYCPNCGAKTGSDNND
ncbi:MAG: hypothetical protein II453_11525, partial [Alphaproteobacteria bacterium]|nr:hypothetical protein [Alphaproteobacteria bacterium]